MFTKFQFDMTTKCKCPETKCFFFFIHLKSILNQSQNPEIWVKPLIWQINCSMLHNEQVYYVQIYMTKNNPKPNFKLKMRQSDGVNKHGQKNMVSLYYPKCGLKSQCRGH